MNIFAPRFLLYAKGATALGHGSLFWLGLIWTAHIGMDRLLGFGLKYETTFKDTHLVRVL